jgi:sortase B
MIVALGVFIYSAYSLTLIYIESKESMDVYDEVKSMFISDGSDGEILTDEEGMTISNSSTGGVFTWDYEKMLSYNQEALGYIRQDNGDYIDNPILQHTDNDYYLNHLANNQASSVGSIFVDYRIEEGLEARNAIIYGHNMGRRVNNIMFGSLNWYYYCSDDPDYYKNHPTFDVYVGYKHYKYYVFAIYKTETEGGWTYTYSFEDDEAFLKYVNDCIARSKYTFDQAGEITAEDKIITLSTCTESDEKRMIVQAVRREQIDDVPNVPDDETVTGVRGIVSIGGEETTETAETTTEQVTEATTQAATAAAEPEQPATQATTVAQATTAATKATTATTKATTAAPTTQAPTTTTAAPTTQETTEETTTPEPVAEPPEEQTTGPPEAGASEE